MKCITIHQPYAHLIAIGEKRIENRTWHTHHQGWLAIHAGKSNKWLRYGDAERYPNMARGAIVAVAWLALSVRIEKLAALATLEPEMSWAKDHEHAEGPVCWLLSQVIPLTRPLEVCGQQGLWTLDEATVSELRGLVGYHRRNVAPGWKVVDKAS